MVIFKKDNAGKNSSHFIGDTNTVGINKVVKAVRQSINPVNDHEDDDYAGHKHLGTSVNLHTQRISTILFESQPGIKHVIVYVSFPKICQN